MASDNSYWSPDGWVSPDGSFVPAAAIPTKAQVAAAPSWAGGPPKPMNTNVDYQPSMGLGMTAETTGDNPLWGRTPQGPVYPSLPITGPMPPQRPSVPLPPARPSALQQYQAATTPSTFGSTAPLPPPRPQEDGPPMPTQDQMAQLQAPPAQPTPWEPNFTRHDGGSDPSSAMAFLRQQMAPTQGTLDNSSGSGLMSLFHNLSGSNPAQGNGSGKSFQWVRPDSIVGKLMSLMGDHQQGKPMNYSDGPLGRIMQSFSS